MLLPDVPTAAEAGLPGYISESWFGVAIRSGAPQEVQEKLQKALIDAGFGISGLSIERPGLHDAFVRIVGADALDDDARSLEHAA